jgi:hypothetical protein
VRDPPLGSAIEDSQGFHAVTGHKRPPALV